MKDSEFIELLNLYLDHEITPANAARLEDEVRRNPGRRRIYLQYCGIHKACGIIAADFSTARPAPRRESVAAGLGWAAAGFASFGVVAAGLAVAFVLWQRAPEISGGQTTLAQADLVQTESSTKPAARHGLVAAADRISPASLALTGESLGLPRGLRPGGAVETLAAARASDGLDWLREFQVAGMPNTDSARTLRFDHSTLPIRPEARQLGLKAQADAAEMTAFRFSK